MAVLVCAAMGVAVHSFAGLMKAKKLETAVLGHPARNAHFGSTKSETIIQHYGKKLKVTVEAL